MNHRLENKRALITGGSRGIGAAIVKRLAQEGAHVALTYVSKPDRAEEMVKAAQALGVKALAIKADSANAEAVVAAVERTVEELGGIDILVNSAGIAVVAPIDDLRLEDFDRILAVNVRAVFVATQAAVKHMQSGGRVINVGSCNAERVPNTGMSAYATSKAALVGLVKGLARDLGPRGITINNVQPGPDRHGNEPRQQAISRRCCCSSWRCLTMEQAKISRRWWPIWPARRQATLQGPV